MSRWEDIIKTKLSEFESPLPEACLEEFHARMGRTEDPARGKGLPLFWLYSTAIATVIVAFVFYIHRTDKTLDESSIFAQSAIEISDSEIPASGTLETILSIRPNIKQVLSEPYDNLSPVHPDSIGPAAETHTAITADTGTTPIMTEPGFSLTKPASATRPIKILKTTGAVLSTGLGGLLLVRSGFRSTIDITGGYASYSSAIPGFVAGYSLPDTMDIIEIDHLYPIKTGLSIRIPLSDRLSLTTGAEYSLYRSAFYGTIKSSTGYDIDGGIQRSHYIGLPLRIDWSYLSGQIFEAYLGGGIKTDFCVGSTYKGKKMRKDGPLFSLQGLTGIQLNASKNLGIYLESGLDWTILSENMKINNYRKEHPLMLSVSSGIRVTIK